MTIMGRVEFEYELFYYFTMISLNKTRSTDNGPDDNTHDPDENFESLADTDFSGDSAMSGDSDALVDDFEKYNFNYDFNDLASNDGTDGASIGTYDNDSHAGEGLQDSMNISGASTYNRVDEDRMMFRGDMANGSCGDFQEFNMSTYGDGSAGNMSKLDFEYITY